MRGKLVLPQFTATLVEEVVAANSGVTLQRQIASSDLVDSHTQKRLVLQWKAVVGPVCLMVRTIAAARNTADHARHRSHVVEDTTMWDAAPLAVSF